LDAEPHLPIALGASIEVESQALAAQNRRDEAVLFLTDEVKKWQGTSIRDRIQKNLNLLTLEGKPVPVLDISHSIGARKPLPLSAHRGHPVLLFLWAHWCSDCKNEIAIVQKLMANYGPRGLVVVAPTQHYGYVAGGQDAPRDVETKYIGEVFAQYYSGIRIGRDPLERGEFRPLRRQHNSDDGTRGQTGNRSPVQSRQCQLRSLGGKDRGCAAACRPGLIQSCCGISRLF
jgi:thiol-disulfide isomerase/thioredoxin